MPFNDLRVQERARKRDYIIDSAEKLFFSKGYDTVTMDDIAKVVGLNKATIYFYFKSKESLYLAIVLRAVRLLDQVVKETVNNARPGIQRIDAISNAYTWYYSVSTDYTRVYRYFRAGRFGKIDAEDVSEYLDEITELEKEIFNTVCDVVKAGIEDGTVRPDVHPADVAILIISTTETVMENALGMRPDVKSALESRGLSNMEYMTKYRNFLHLLILNKKQ